MWLLLLISMSGANTTEKYSHEVTADKILEHLDHKFLEYDPRDVQQFTNEEDLFDRMDMAANPKPILIKFYEEWCAVCSQLKPVQLAA